jgi:hypothetical protein
LQLISAEYANSTLPGSALPSPSHATEAPSHTTEASINNSNVGDAQAIGVTSLVFPGDVTTVDEGKPFKEISFMTANHGDRVFVERKAPYNSRMYGAVDDENAALPASLMANSEPESPIAMNAQRRHEPETRVRVALSANFDRASNASSRRSAGRKLQDRLRRVMADTHSSLLPGLVWLRIVGIVIIILAAVLGIAISAFVSTEFTRYSFVLDGCSDAAGLLRDGIAVTRHVRYLTLCSRHWLACTEEQDSRSIIQEQSAEFSSSHRSLHALSIDIGYEAEYETPHVPVIYFEVDATTTDLRSSQQQTSLFEAGLQLVNAAQIIAIMPLPNITRGEPNVEFLIANAFKNGSIHDAFNATIFSWLRNSRSVESSVAELSTAVFICMVVICIATASCGVLPILLHVDRTRDRYITPFMQLPPAIPARLRANAESRLRKLKATELEAEEASGSDSDREEVLVADMDESASLGSGSATDWQALLQAEQSRKKLKDGKWRRGTLFGPNGRAFKKSISSLLLLVANFILPLLLVIGFFAAIYGQTVSTLQQTHIVQGYAVVSAQQLLEVNEVPMLVRGLLSIRGTPEQITPNVEVLNRLIDSLAYHHRLILFTGQPADPLVDSLTTTSTSAIRSFDGHGLEDAMYGDACSFIASNNPPTSFQYSSCAAFRGGIMRQGMHAAISDFLQVARRVVNRRAAASVLVTSASGDGVIVTANASVAYSLIEELQSADLTALFDYADNYLDPGLKAYADVFIAVATAEVSYMQAFLIILVTLFVVLFTGYQVLVYLPHVHFTNEDIKDERVMVLLLPAGIVNSVTALQTMVQDMLTSEESNLLARG